MELNKQTVKALLGVVCGGIAFAAALLHLDVVAGAAGLAAGHFVPAAAGLCHRLYSQCPHAGDGALPVSPRRKSQ